MAFIKGGSYSQAIKGETATQSAVCSYLQHRNLLYNHCMNEGKRTKFERYLMKVLGVQTGYPDLEIFSPPDNRGGVLYIELKHDKNRLTDNQLYWLTELNKRPFCYSYMAYTTDSAIRIIDNHICMWKGDPRVDSIIKVTTENGFFYMDELDVFPKAKYEELGYIFSH